MPWPWPTFLFLIALAGLAVHPQVVLGYPEIDYRWGPQQTLIGLALVANALTYGLRRLLNWPILALLAVLALNLALGHPDPQLTIGLMLISLLQLALPWSFTQVVMAPDARRACALVIALAPLLSLAAAGVLQAVGVLQPHPVRLRGAAGDPAVFATLAFAGFVVALHEATRFGERAAAGLALLDLALVILSATRMAIFASVLFLVVYGLRSADFRHWLRTRPVLAIAAGCIPVGVLLWYFPTLEHRLTRRGGFRWSGRDELWDTYFDQLRSSPWFGRGFGVGFVAAGELPHNEYLHLLVIGGAVGFLLCILGIGLWCRRLLITALAADRGFLIALASALAAYCLTDNLLVYASGLGLYAYLGMLPGRPGALAPEPAGGAAGPKQEPR